MRFNSLIAILLAIVFQRIDCLSFPYSRCLQTDVYCQSLPESCLRENGVCDTVLIVSSASDGLSSVELQLLGRSDISRHWFAMALADHRPMANDSVTEIYSIFVSNDSSNQDLRQTWNLRRGSKVLNDNQVNGIRAQGNVLVEDGIVSAKWTRDTITQVIHDSTTYELDIDTHKPSIMMANSVDNGEH